MPPVREYASSLIQRLERLPMVHKIERSGPTNTIYTNADLGHIIPLCKYDVYHVV